MGFGSKGILGARGMAGLAAQARNARSRGDDPWRTPAALPDLSDGPHRAASGA